MKLNISLSPRLEAFVAKQVTTCLHKFASEVVHAALRLMEERALTYEATMSWLKQEIDKGLASSPTEPVSREFWERLRGQLRNYPA
jgi:putative addiction module CopG family antidote